MLLDIHSISGPLSAKLLRKFLIRFRGQLQVFVAHVAGVRLGKSMCNCCDVFDLVHVSQQTRSAQQHSGTHLSSIEI